MNEDEMLENSQHWTKSSKTKYRHEETGNVVEVVPIGRPPNENGVDVVEAVLYTPNKVKPVVKEAGDMDELYERLEEFFSEYNRIIGAV